MGRKPPSKCNSSPPENGPGWKTIRLPSGDLFGKATVRCPSSRPRKHPKTMRANRVERLYHPFGLIYVALSWMSLEPWGDDDYLMSGICFVFKIFLLFENMTICCGSVT